MNGQLDLPSQFFDDMAWGGLTTYKNENDEEIEFDFFKNAITDASDRERIKNTIQIELTGKDRNGQNEDQQGNDADC